MAYFDFKFGIWSCALSIPGSHDPLQGVEHKGHSFGPVPSHLGNWHKIISSQPLVSPEPCRDSDRAVWRESHEVQPWHRDGKG